MKKLHITKEQFSKSKYLKQKYGKLKFVSESGRYYKTDKGEVLNLFHEAKEYIDDDSIDVDSAEEFIIFDDPKIFEQISNVQKKEEKKVDAEIKEQGLTKQDVQEIVDNAKYDGPGIGTQIASSAITATGNIVSNPAVVGLAAAAYGGNKLSKGITDVYDAYQSLQKARANNAKIQAGLQKHKDEFARNGIDFDMMCKGQNYVDNLSDKQMEELGFNAIPDEGYMHNMDYHKLVAQGLPQKDRESYLQSAENLCKTYGPTAGAAGAAAVASGGAGAAAAGSSTAASAATGTAATGTGWTLFGMSAATIGWIVAGVAAAAVITPYIYDKVRACTKTWLADIIAEIKFKAEGKNYRCFYDLDENKWVLTYADIKWTSYMDNKLDQDTQEEFFSSRFFQNFLSKCKQTFAFLFSTGKNEVVFKTLPEIKDAPEELKEILEKIYDNKGAITKNLFTGKH